MNTGVRNFLHRSLRPCSVRERPRVALLSTQVSFAHLSKPHRTTPTRDTLSAAHGNNDPTPHTDPAHQSSANETLANRLQAAAPSPEAYQQFRSKASALLRNQTGSPLQLFQSFVSLYGQSDESLLLFIDLAELAPDQELRSELITVAGFGTLIPDTRESDDTTSAEPRASRATPVRGHRTATPSAMPAQTQDTTGDTPATIPADRAQRSNTPEASTTTQAGSPDRQQVHGAPAPLFTGSPSATSGPQGPTPAFNADPPPPATAAAAASTGNPEASLASLGINPELWGGQVDDSHPGSSSERGAKRKRSPQRSTAAAAAGAGGMQRGEGSALSLLDGSSTDTAGVQGGGDAEAAGVVYWIRQDFRLHDNPALCRAAQLAAAAGGKVLCAFVHSPEEDGDDVWTGSSWRPGQASLLWTQHALESMSADLTLRYGAAARIVYARGPAADALPRLCAVAGAARVVASRRHEPAMRAADARTEATLEAAGIQVEWTEALLLHAPETITINMAAWRGHFGTLMPFYVACEKAGGFVGKAQRTADVPAALPGAAGEACEEALAEAGAVELPELQLYAPPTRADGSVADWGASIREVWDISEAAALNLLEDFIACKLEIYESSRALARGDAVSRLSPYLHFGMISPRTVMARLAAAGAKSVSKTFWRRLVWRDLAYWQLHHWPRMPTHSIRPAYERQAWAFDAATLRRWQAGRTGFPLVDAGMRELWATGYMHQNVRMVVACFLTEYLSLHWVHGARWFHDTLVDADLAINSMMWQNAGKAGLDQWNFSVLPYSKAADSKGDYIRRWVPEVGSLPTKYVHTPWDAPVAVLEKAGVRLGDTYPQRVTTADMSKLRHENVLALRAAREAHAREHPADIDGGGYDVIDVPTGAAKGASGGRVRVFTVPGLRGPVAKAGEYSKHRNNVAAGRGRGRGQGRGGGGGRRGGKKELAAGQKTLRECIPAK
eukprot:jgi/Ulvmu1/1930/UM012_0090.1